MKHETGQPPNMRGVKFVSGLYYKRCRETSAFYWDGDQWRVSVRTWAEVLAKQTVTPHKGNRKNANTKY